MRRLLVAVFLLFLAGCTTVGTLPPTLGEQASGYGYIPLDGLAVDQTLESDSCKGWRQYSSKQERGMFSTPNDFGGERAGSDPFKPLLETLPDISVRFAVAAFDSYGALTYGPAKITSKYNSYRAVLDYVNVDAIPVSLWITAFQKSEPIKLSDARGNGAKIDAYEVKVQFRDAPPMPPHSGKSELVTLPVYVGVGMRLTADVTALEGGIPLISLGTIGLEAAAKRLTGTLTVQTIGITGESVAASLPLPSKLDQTTIENGILSIGSNRAVVYRDQSKGKGITTTPRVVGLYSPIGSEPALINAIYSELSRERPQWARPCNPPN